MNPRNIDVPYISLYMLLIWSVAAYFLTSCVNNSGPDCRNDVVTPCIPPDDPNQKLSDYNLFERDIKNLNPVEGILPYNLNSELFSDYAQKLRFVYLPAGSSVDYSGEGILNFPVGTVLIKTFYYDLDTRNPAAGRRLIETRLLMHQEPGWRAETYIWNEEQTEAFLEQSGGQKVITWTDVEGIGRHVNYLIPTKNDCKTCHSYNGNLVPLGPKVPNLNKTYPYDDGPANQLVRWEMTGILHGKPELVSIPHAPAWDDSSTGTLERRARIYLDVNCSHCHRREGSAGNTGLFLTYGEEDPYSLGIYKPPVASGNGSGGLDYNIVPGEPDQSIMVFRMESVEPEERMPEIGRTVVHEEAVELIHEWIKGMELPAEN